MTISDVISTCANEVKRDLTKEEFFMVNWAWQMGRQTEYEETMKMIKNLKDLILK